MNTRHCKSVILTALLSLPAALSVQAGQIVVDGGYTTDPFPHAAYDDSGGVELTDGDVGTAVWPGGAVAGPLVGWQNTDATVTFNFGAPVTIAKITAWFADSDGSAGVGLPESVRVTTSGGFDQLFPVDNPEGSGTTVPVDLEGFEITTDNVTLEIARDTALDNPVCCGGTYEWTMLSEVQFFTPEDPDSPDLIAPVVIDLGTVASDPAVATGRFSISNAEGVTADLVITSMSFSGPDAANFTPGPNPPGLAPGEEAELTFTFDSGGVTGAYTATLEIVSNDPDSPTAIEVRAEVIMPLPNQVFVNGGYTLEPAPSPAYADTGGGELIDGDVGTEVWPGGAVTPPLVGWQHVDATATFRFLAPVTLGKITAWFGDSGGSAGVGLPESVRVTTPGGFDQLFPVADPDGSGTTVPIDLTGFVIATDEVTLHIARDTAVDNPLCCGGTYEWTMLSEVQFFAPENPDAPNLNAPARVDLGKIPNDPARVQGQIPISNGFGVTEDLVISSMSFLGLNASDFTAGLNPPSLSPGEAGEITFTFNSGGNSGVYQAILEIVSNAPDSPSLVEIRVEVVPDQVFVDGGYTATPSTSPAYEDTGGVELTDGDVGTLVWPGAAVIAPLVGWQNIDATVTFNFASPVTLGKIRAWFGDSDGSAGVGLPESVRVIAGGFDQLFPVVNPDGSGTVVPIDFDGFVITTDSVTLEIARDTALDNPLCCGGTYEWTMLTEVEFFAPDNLVGPNLKALSHDPETDTLTISWESREGRLYNLRSETGLSTDPRDWPIFGVHQDLLATPPENTLTIPRPADPERFFVIEEFPAPPVVLLFEDFESGEGEWTTGSDGAAGTTWELGVPSGVGPVAANSPENCFGTNVSADYGLDANIWLRSPVIDLTEATAATLRYFQFFDIEEGFDFGTVSVIDAGDNSELAVLQPVVDGVSGEWVRINKPLPVAALGRPVKLEFRFQSDDIGNFAGWYLDDVEVIKP